VNALGADTRLHMHTENANKAISRNQPLAGLCESGLRTETIALMLPGCTAGRQAGRLVGS